MTARLVEVRDDYPMPASEQIISLAGRQLLGFTKRRRSNIPAKADWPVQRVVSLVVV